MEVIKKYMCEKSKSESKKDSKNDNVQNKQQTIKSQSTGAIFGLPKSIINKFHKEKSDKFRSTLFGFTKLKDDGSISARQYHSYLRNTILNHTKEVFGPQDIQNQFPNSKFEPILLKKQLKNSSKNIIQKKPAQNSQKTLNILQKVILKGTGYIEREQELIQLSANKLPIVRRQQSRRKQSLSVFDSKHFGYLPPSPKERPFKQNTHQKRQKMEILPWEIREVTHLYE